MRYLEGSTSTQKNENAIQYPTVWLLDSPKSQSGQETNEPHLVSASVLFTCQSLQMATFILLFPEGWEQGDENLQPAHISQTPSIERIHEEC